MLNPGFESRLTAGVAQWITFIEDDDDRAEVRIGVTHHPESNRTERTIEFCSVSCVSSEWFDRDDKCAESIIGAREKHLGDSIQYMLHTDQRELFISTTQSVTISDRDS